MHPDQQTPDEHRSSNADNAPDPADGAPDATSSGEAGRIPEQKETPATGDPEGTGTPAGVE